MEPATVRSLDKCSWLIALGRTGCLKTTESSCLPKSAGRPRDGGEFVIGVVKFMLHAGRIIMGNKVWRSILPLWSAATRQLCFSPPQTGRCACQRLCTCGGTFDPCRCRPAAARPTPFVAPPGRSANPPCTGTRAITGHGSAYNVTGLPPQDSRADRQIDLIHFTAGPCIEPVT